MEKSTKSKIALGLILGVAAGAAVYYFMTNENGKEQFSDLLSKRDCIRPVFKISKSSYRSFFKNNE